MRGIVEGRQNPPQPVADDQYRPGHRQRPVPQGRHVFHDALGPPHVVRSILRHAEIQQGMQHRRCPERTGRQEQRAKGQTGHEVPGERAGGAIGGSAMHQHEQQRAEQQGRCRRKSRANQPGQQHAAMDELFPGGPGRNREDRRSQRESARVSLGNAYRCLDTSRTSRVTNWRQRNGPLRSTVGRSIQFRHGHNNSQLSSRYDTNSSANASRSARAAAAPVLREVRIGISRIGNTPVVRWRTGACLGTFRITWTSRSAPPVSGACGAVRCCSRSCPWRRAGW